MNKVSNVRSDPKSGARLSIAKYLAGPCITLLAACGSSIPGLGALEKACKEEAVLVVNQIHYVEGFYTDSKRCTSCVETLIKEGFRFIEFKLDDPDPLDPYQEPGLWRIERVNKDSRECNARIAKKLEKKKASPYFQFKAEYCIATYKVDELSSEYRFVQTQDWEKVIDSEHESKFRRYSYEVSNIETGELVARKVSFTLIPRPNASLAYGHSKHCADVGVPLKIEGKEPSIRIWTLRAKPQE
jgi:hypothetical protein